MQVALTKKLADAMGIKPAAAREDGNPLFTWTANWTRVWDNHEADDILVLVNNATRFTVAIYQVKRQDIKKTPDMLLPAIKNTLLAMNLNPELVEEYLRLAGEIELVRNHNRRAAGWVSKAGLECAFTVGRRYDGVEKVFNDTAGLRANGRTVDYLLQWPEWF